MKPLRLLLADDHILVRAGLRALLDGMPEITVVAEADDGEQAAALAARHRPDIALLDISMPGMNGLQAAERILRELPDIRVLILSMHASDEYVTQALKLGVSGYLLKDAATLELQAALEAVSSGKTYLSPRITGQLLQAKGLRQADSPAHPALSARQIEVLKLLALGRSVKEIAYELQLSAKTIETHRAQIMDKLGVRDLASLVRYAIRTGLISADV